MSYEPGWREITAKRVKSWPLGSGKGRIAHDRVFGLGIKSIKIARGGKWRYISLQPKGETEIPDEVGSSDTGLPSSISFGPSPVLPNFV